MGAEILGLMTTEQFAATRSENARRSIFWAFPQGRFPLAGLLSLIEEGETITDVIAGWWEERYKTSKSLLAQVSSGKGPFATSVVQNGSPVYTSIDVDFTVTVNSTICLFVQDATLFRVRDTVQLMRAIQTGGTTYATYTLVVTQLDLTNNVIYGYWIDIGTAATTVDVTSNQLVTYAVMTSNATAEGDRSLEGGTTIPTLIQNFTQISRTPFRMTGSALQIGQRYDQTGPYKKAAKMNALRHMESIESSLFFGVRRQETTTTVDGEATTRRFMGGIYYYLKQWELQNTNNGGQFDYAIGATSVLASTWQSSDRKRIISVNGTITKAQWNNLIERAFYRTSNNTYQKLVICAAGFLQVIQDFCENNSIRIHQLNPKDEAFGMRIFRIDTVFGELLIKGHPLFIENPSLRFSAFILDIGNLAWLPLMGRDTNLLKWRQPNDADYRKDEWMGEGTLRVTIPESCMFIDNCTGIIS